MPSVVASPLDLPQISTAEVGSLEPRPGKPPGVQIGADEQYLIHRRLAQFRPEKVQSRQIRTREIEAATA